MHSGSAHTGNKLFSSNKKTYLGGKMPKVKGKKFPYTKDGVKAAKKFAKKMDAPVKMAKKKGKAKSSAREVAMGIY